VVSGAASITLTKNGNLAKIGRAQIADCWSAVPSSEMSVGLRLSEPFLRIPPFPGAKIRRFADAGEAGPIPCDLIDELRRQRVGGTYWAAQPPLGSDYVLIRSAGALEAARNLAGGRQIVLWQVEEGSPASGVSTVRGHCDPWHMLESATAVVVDRDDELRLIAALLDVPTHLYDPASRELARDRADPTALLAQALSSRTFQNPFTGERMSARECVELCGFWRRLIDSNREIAAGLGFAFWKQDHIEPLLWNGSTPFRFLRDVAEVPAGAAMAIWQAKVHAEALAQLERSETPTVEVEDGFLRSRGLGADCIPPLSVTVDRLGAHFDPSEPSELENMLQYGKFDEELLARARALREELVEAGIGKYERASVLLDRPAGERRHILVPGQVEDDRAVRTGGCGLTSNLELLRRVREQAPDAYILYKPHPDVLAGHRRGSIPDRICRQYADQIVSELPITSLIAMADEVHVNTSLAGFEALLRGKPVTTHGVPFYAGWGLTHDLGPVPSRRTARRTIDEVVAATLLLYPRYLDPVTGLPCPAEIVVARLRVDEGSGPGLLVGIRRLQGKLMRRLRSLVQ